VSERSQLRKKRTLKNDGYAKGTLMKRPIGYKISIIIQGSITDVGCKLRETIVEKFNDAYH